MKISVVLFLIRNTLGVQQTPPNLVLYGIVLILSVYVTTPLIGDMYRQVEGRELNIENVEQLRELGDALKPPLQAHLSRFANESERGFFVQATETIWTPEARADLRDDDLVVVVAVTIAVPMFVPVFGAFTALPEHGSFFLVGLMIKEMLIGLLIGLLFGIPFWAAEVAGELIDLQRGSTTAQLVDPLSSGESSVMATLLTVMLIALFFMSGGFIMMVDGYYHSYQLWPATAFTPLFASSALMAVLSILDQVMRMGVVMGSPLIICLLATDLMLAYLSRMAPSLHIFDRSLPVKNLFFSVLMVIYISFLISVMIDQLAKFRGTVELLKALLVTERRATLWFQFCKTSCFATVAG